MTTSSGTSNGQWFPASWPERIRALTNGELIPVTPRRAATVLLLRDTASGGPAVHMLRRRASMAFAGGAYAYPGGGVDPRDEKPVRWAGRALDAWSAALGVDPVSAQAVVCAAVRETFEESGVLLAGPDGGSVVADTTGESWEADREALVSRELSFADFLARRELVLRSDLLGPWARWITPEFEERRYDTWFFLAMLPTGQRTLDVSGEADHTVWLRPAEAVEGYRRGEMVMMPPTIATLRALLPYDSVGAALAGAADQDLTPVLARAVLEGEEIVLSWPGHEEFTKHIPAPPEHVPAPPQDSVRPQEPAPSKPAPPKPAPPKPGPPKPAPPQGPVPPLGATQ
ncbi:NUDIX hydrolase [Streptomyces sp. H10-C2]|uniref:NUDIX hydrolase n=1 Tax=unclassified Streptomyces TaxID=2593676 RepID=UPI0024B9229A|nr:MULTISPECIES: NUDIX hydrolase [unclassified Streptomyces]MDJ0342657.1 NUDIX hydrolase [Streptomyces sp. PH10-H1]MDJ0368489.1 NUDIX hydrolase [Streptomyces sp. H10-C2]